MASNEPLRLTRRYGLRVAPTGDATALSMSPVVATRLGRRVASGGARVTCVTAGPGYGKRTLVERWARSSGTRLVRLDLPESCEPARFWAAVGRALLAAQPGDSGRAGRCGDPGRALSLLRDLGTPSSRVALVLDGYHRIENDLVHDGVAWLAERLGGRVHIVIVACSDPPLPLSQWRRRGWLCEIRQHDLALTIGEARAALRAGVRTRLGDDQLDRLAERVGWWPLGVHLEAEAIGTGGAVADPSVVESRAEAALATYVQREMLDAVTPETVAFLLATSVLDTLTAQRCAELTGLADTSTILRGLARDGLVTRLGDAADHAYVLPEVLARLLRAELDRRVPGALASAHRQAARLFVSAGEPRVALRHLTGARDAELAFRLLLDSRPPCARSQGVPALGSWLERLPAGVFTSDPVGALRYAAGIGANGRTVEALTLLRRLTTTSRWCTQDFRTEASWAMAIGHAQLGALDEMRAWLGVLRHEAPDSVPQGPLARHWPEIPWAAAALDDWRLAAKEWEWGCEHDLHAGWGPAGKEQLQAVLDVQRGFVARAAPVLQASLACSEDTGALPSAVRTHLLRSAALAAAERHELWEAERLVHAARWSCDAQDHRSLGRAAVEAVAAEIARRAGDPARALALAARARGRITPGTDPDGPPSLLAEIEVRAAFDLQDLRTLEEARERVGRPLARALAAARSLLVRGARGGARDLLLAQLDRAEPRTQGPARALEALLLLVLAAGTTSESEATLACAVELAREAGLGGSLVAGVPSPEGLARLGGLGRLEPGDHLRAVVRARPVMDQSRPSEPLSPREREVLGLLPSELSNQELADELFVSLNTVKTHLKVIYRKLGAEGRSDAVHRARELRLLPPRF